MEEGINETPKAVLVSDGISEVSDMDEDDEDGFMVNDMDDYYNEGDEVFELPLKASNFRYKNFSALNDDWGSFSNNCSNSGIGKRVRFDNNGGCENEDNRYADDSSNGRSRSDSPKGKRKVEELLQYANQVNEYLALNLEKIDSFRSELMNSDGVPYKSISSENTAGTTATTVSGSISNFELSENEVDDDNKYSLNASVSSDFERTWDSEPLLQYSRNEELKVPSLEEIIQQVRRANEREEVNENKIMKENDPSNSICETVEISQAISIFQDTINCVLRMSEIEDVPVAYSHHWDYSHFFMKSLPSVPYQDFIARIQSKCLFSPAVFLASAFLLQTLCLIRDETNGKLHLRHKVQNPHVHRLVIACVRISTKIMEDYVHSHHYFCKVCGISKGLLSRLEMSLVACLKDEKFIVTRKRLASTSKVRDELRDCQLNYQS